MSTFVEIASAIPKLTVTELTQLEQVVQRELEQRQDTPTGDVTQPCRVLGLHAGAWSETEDFDAPLPDDFWLGEDT